MHKAVRITMAVALAAPLVASTLPASASSISLYREKGAFADVFFEGAGTPGGLPGNYSFGSFTFRSSDLAEGFVDTFACDEGETPWGDENGDNACDATGSYYGWGEGLTLVSGKGKNASSTFTGTVDLYDATTPDGALAAEEVPFNVTLTPTGAVSRTTISDSFTDPDAGISYRFRESRVSHYATVRGSLDGVPAVDGAVGTYSLRGMERID